MIQEKKKKLIYVGLDGNDSHPLEKIENKCYAHQWNVQVAKYQELFILDFSE